MCIRDSCDGLDDDCDTFVDEGLPTYTYYLDGDGDSYGDPNFSSSVTTCAASPPNGYVTDASDCADNDPGRHPGQGEVCDGVDQDCNGTPDDGMVFQDYFPDSDGDGYGNDKAAYNAVSYTHLTL